MMNNMNVLTHENKETWVQGLMIDCPMGKALESCPAKAVRALPLQERFALVKQMEESQLDEIIAHHRRCLKEREGI
jgi:hypothetical protein